MKKLSIRELAQYLSVTKRTVQRRAIKEDWPFDQRIGLGGTKRLYNFNTLPEQVKSKVVAAIIARHEAHVVPQMDAQQEGYTPFIVEDEKDPYDWLSQHCFSHKMDNSELNKDYLKLGLLALARLFVEQAGKGKIKGFDEFCQQYNERLLDIDEAIYNVIKQVSRISLLRWEKKEQELAFAADNEHKAAQPAPAFDKELRAIADEILMVSPNITAKLMRQHFLTFFSDKPTPDESQLQLWIRQAKSY